MNLLTQLLLGAALCAPLSGLAEEAAKTASLTTSLEQLGYPNGMVFDGSTQPSEQTILFHLPKEMTVKSATLCIVYRGSAQLGRGALLRAVINELPPQVREVEADRGFREWRIEVPESELEGPGMCGAVVNWVAPAATDNCPGVAVSQIGGMASGSFFPLGTSFVDFMAADVAGNVSFCSFTVTVTDGEPPTFTTCPANITLSNSPGSCSAAVNWAFLLQLIIAQA